MQKNTIIYIDSGLGGLHILAKSLGFVGKSRVIYVADAFNSPYGTKSKKQLKNIAINLISYLEKKYDPNLYVIACNTLTVNTISKLRKRFKKQFVGVEPPLKQAKLNGGKTLLLATQSTLKYYNALNKKITRQLKNLSGNYKGYNGVCYRVALPNLPSLIEQNCLDIQKLKPLLEPLKTYDVENIVLGCTHFTAIKSLLEKLFPNASVLDNCLAVAKRVGDICGEQKGEVKKIKFVVTNGNIQLKNDLIKYFKKIYNKEVEIS